MNDRHQLADALAGAFLAGPWRAEELAERGASAVDGWPAWLVALAMRVVAVERSPPSSRPLVALIERFLAEHGVEAGPLPRRAAASRARRWSIEPVPTVGELADALELSVGQLAWLADVRGLERTAGAEKLRNYRYRIIPRASGVPRLIEAPKARLKEIQRWILRAILDRIPAHESAHGFTPGRSVLSHARLHIGRRVVVRLDVRDFFASVTVGRVYGIFRAAGHTPAVAHVLTGLTTNTVPVTVWGRVAAPHDPRLVQPHFWLGRRLATPHLPQGAPTSPALANLAAFRLDRRLAGLAGRWGLRYSRYADDLTFSGSAPLRRRTTAFEALVATIARDEGFVLNRDKARISGAGERQVVCGVVVNARPNVTRREYDRLKATLHHAAVDGPAGVDPAALRAQLRGRIAWVAALNPARGEKLLRRFAAIDWD